MKKILLPVLFVLITMVSSYAQVALGVKGGVNFSNIEADDPFENADARTGYHFGAFVELGLGEVIAIQPEVLFSTKGTDDDVDFSYLEVPVLVKARFADIFNIHLGPQFGILTSAESQGQDVKDFMKSTDVSALLGAGVDLPVGFVAGARYAWGLSNVWDEGDVDVKNKTFQIYIGWKFGGQY